MEQSIFTKIINGEIPCYKIYEDERTIAFLDIHPIQPGHVLVVPKTQIADFYALNDGDYSAFFDTVKRIAIHLHEKFPGKKRIGVMLEGLDVEHVHAKLFAIDSSEEYRNRPDMSIDPDHAALAQMADYLKIEESINV